MKALITGITGQMGSYMADLLLSKGYEIYGLQRQTATPNTKNIEHVLSQITLVPGNMADQTSLDNAIKKVQPDEVYDFAAQSFVKASWDVPEETANITGLGTLRLLEAVRKHKPDAKLYHSSTSEMFGKVKDFPQNEQTAFYPRSPYGVAKLAAHWWAINYRESYNLAIYNGIMFNCESPRRGDHFVTQKIAKGVANIKKGLQQDLILGNLEAKRDIGHPIDYTNAIWLMLQFAPDDYVIASGETHSIQEMVEFCFGYVGLNWKDYVKQDPKFMRPAEVDLLLGDSTKARTILNWTPRYNFETILAEMVDKAL